MPIDFSDLQHGSDDPALNDPTAPQAQVNPKDVLQAAQNNTTVPASEQVNIADVLQQAPTNPLTDGSDNQHLQDVTENTLGNVSDVLHSAPEAIKSVLEGSRNWLEGTRHIVNQAANFLSTPVNSIIGAINPEAGKNITEMQKEVDQQSIPQLPDELRPQTDWGKSLADITTSVENFVGISKVMGMMGWGSEVAPYLRNITASFGTGFATPDAYQQNMSNLVQKVPGLQNPVTAFLASSPDDPEAVARFKKGIEFAAGSAAVEPLFKVFSVMKGVRAAQAAGGDEAAAHYIVDTAPTMQEALDSLYPSTSTTDAASGEATLKTGIVESAPALESESTQSPTVEPIIQHVKAAISQTGTAPDQVITKLSDTASQLSREDFVKQVQSLSQDEINTIGRKVGC